MRAFCLRCQDWVTILNPVTVILKSKATGIRGKCQQGHPVMAIVRANCIGNAADDTDISLPTTSREEREC